LPKYKSLLKPYEIVVAKKKRICKHNRDHIICKGEKCLIIGESQKDFPYCMHCAYEIFKQAYETVFGEFEQTEELTKPKIINF
jgi:hypothetical protein